MRGGLSPTPFLPGGSDHARLVRRTRPRRRAQLLLRSRPAPRRSCRRHRVSEKDVGRRTPGRASFDHQVWFCSSIVALERSRPRGRHGRRRADPARGARRSLVDPVTWRVPRTTEFSSRPRPEPLERRWGGHGQLHGGHLRGFARCRRTRHRAECRLDDKPVVGPPQGVRRPAGDKCETRPARGGGHGRARLGDCRRERREHETAASGRPYHLVSASQTVEGGEVAHVVGLEDGLSVPLPVPGWRDRGRRRRRAHCPRRHRGPGPQGRWLGRRGHPRAVFLKAIGGTVCCGWRPVASAFRQVPVPRRRASGLRRVGAGSTTMGRQWQCRRRRGTRSRP